MALEDWKDRKCRQTSGNIRQGMERQEEPIERPRIRVNGKIDPQINTVLHNLEERNYHDQ
jgi:hypothetical protein